MSSSAVTVKVDTKLCIAAASCVNIMPQLFDLDEENVAFLIDPAGGGAKTSVTFEASAEELALIQEAVANCPT